MLNETVGVGSARGQVPALHPNDDEWFSGGRSPGTVHVPNRCADCGRETEGDRCAGCAAVRAEDWTEPGPAPDVVCATEDCGRAAGASGRCLRCRAEALGIDRDAELEHLDDEPDGAL
jgi:hypothetical protein